MLNERDKKFMALTSTSFVHQQEIEPAVQRVQSRFAKQLHHVNISLGENWTGAPSIFFRIVVFHEAARIDSLAEFAGQVLPIHKLVDFGAGRGDGLA